MSDRFKAILLLVGITVLFFLIAPYLLRGMLAITEKSLKVVDYPDAVQGHITGVEIERQYHMYYLDNDTEHRYSFNAFDQPLTPAQQQLGLENIDLHLGLRLEVGDYVTKQPNSTVIMVQRGDSTSRWFCSTPEEMEQAHKAAR